MSNYLRNARRNEQLHNRNNESDSDSPTMSASGSNSSSGSARTVLLPSHLQCCYNAELPKLTFSDIVSGMGGSLRRLRNVRDMNRRNIRSLSDEMLRGFVRTLHHSQSLPTIKESYETVTSEDFVNNIHHWRGVHTVTGSSAGESDASVGSPRLMDRGDPPIDVVYPVVRRRSRSLPREPFIDALVPYPRDESPPSRPGSA